MNVHEVLDLRRKLVKKRTQLRKKKGIMHVEMGVFVEECQAINDACKCGGLVQKKIFSKKEQIIVDKRQKSCNPHPTKGIKCNPHPTRGHIHEEF